MNLANPDLDSARPINPNPLIAFFMTCRGQGDGAFECYPLGFVLRDFFDTRDLGRAEDVAGRHAAQSGHGAGAREGAVAGGRDRHALVAQVLHAARALEVPALRATATVRVHHSASLRSGTDTHGSGAARRGAVGRSRHAAPSSCAAVSPGATASPSLPSSAGVAPSPTASATGTTCSTTTHAARSCASICSSLDAGMDPVAGFRRAILALPLMVGRVATCGALRRAHRRRGDVSWTEGSLVRACASRAYAARAAGPAHLTAEAPRAGSTVAATAG
jgi:hypothetical protein